MQSWGGFASLAIVAACWRQIVAFTQRVRSFLVIRVTVTGDPASAITTYCLRTFRRSPVGDRLYASGSAFVRPVRRVQDVAWEKPPPTSLILFDGWKPIMLGGFNSTQGSPASESGLVTLTVIRWLTDYEGLLIAALDEHNRLQGTSNGHSRYRVTRYIGRGKTRYEHEKGTSPEVAGSPSSFHSSRPSAIERYLKWQTDEIGSPKPENPMSAIVVPPCLESTVTEFNRWRESEDWYRKRQVPWRRGWLLHGKPGTGKTSLARCLAQAADMPICVFDLSTLSNEEMTRYWQETQQLSPCVALFEDVDAVFHGRTNVVGETGGGLTFDCLLNCLGGVETADGVFVMVTTNNIELLDEALTRPGRLDRIIEVKPLPTDCLRKIAERIVGEWPDEVEALMENANGLTGAQMTERCVERALERYWEN